MKGGGDVSISDREYSLLWNSLQQQENHVCSRRCEFKHVMGNLYLCATSGQAHVCDQNCSQRIFYDNHSDICRLSRRVFPRAEAAMADLARKRSGEDVEPELVKRTHSVDWQHQQQILQQQALQQAAAAAAQQHPLQHQQYGGWALPAQPAAPPGWGC